MKCGLLKMNVLNDLILFCLMILFSPVILLYGLHVWLVMWRSWVRAPSMAPLFLWARNFTLIA